MILRFLVKFLFLAIAVIALVLFGSKWKLEKTLDEFFAAAKPFVDIQYDSASVSLSGEITVNEITASNGLFGEFFKTNEIKLYKGSLYDLIFADNKLSLQELPEKAYIVFNDTFLSLNTVNSLKAKRPPASALDILSSAYCGSRKQISFKDFKNMGYEYMTFSGEINYQRDQYSNTVILKGFFDADNLAKTQYQINIGNLAKMLESFPMLFTGVMSYNQVKPVIELIDIHHFDQGYNERKANFCAKQENVSLDEYYTGHAQAFESLLNEVDVELTQDFKQAYPQLIKSGTQSHWYFQPKPGFEFSSFDAYAFNDYIDLAGFKLTINDKPVNSFISEGSFEKIAYIPTFIEQKQMRELNPDDSLNYKTFTKEYRSIALSRINQFIDSTIKIKLKNDLSYEGVLTRSSNNKFWVRVRKYNGDVTLPIKHSDVSSLKVLVPKRVKEVNTPSS
jgi:hypothetical protein